MQNKTTNLTDRLLGFDSQRLQREMTQGLGSWAHRHRETVLDRRTIVTTTFISLLMVSCASQLVPTTNYRLGDGQTYEGAVALANYLLEK